MATALGSSVSVSTWGKLRCAWCLALTDNYTSGDYNITYFSGQKASAPGSGLIRWPRLIYGIGEQQPTIYSLFNTSLGNRLFLVPYVTTPPRSPASEQFRDAMIGQTVTMAGGSPVISSTLFDTGVQSVGGTTSWRPITAVGNLTAF